MDEVDKLGEDVRALEALALILTPILALYVYAKWCRYALEKAAFILLVGFGVAFVMITTPQTSSNAIWGDLIIFWLIAAVIVFALYGREGYADKFSYTREELKERGKNIKTNSFFYLGFILWTFGWYMAGISVVVGAYHPNIAPYVFGFAYFGLIFGYVGLVIGAFIGGFKHVLKKL